MGLVAFEKYQGLGNDFIVVHTESPNAFSRDDARRLCDRHFGVGGDGVLLVSPPTNADARARMTVINADGSRPEMCGNGLRCVALHLVRGEAKANAKHAGHEPAHFEFAVETDAGPRRCIVDLSNDPRLAQVTTDMGRAQLQGSLELTFTGQSYRFARVSVGNPHAVRFGPPESLVRVDELGPMVSSLVPDGLNVEFATPKTESEIDVVVWERGVGRTLACGTGACATAVAAAAEGLVAYDAPIRIHLPGGPVIVQVARETLGVELRGPACWVFSGEWTA